MSCSKKWTGGKVKVRCRSREQHRKTLSQPPGWYATEPKCFCGKPFRVDGYRTSGKESKDREKCMCDGVGGYFTKLNAKSGHGRSTLHWYGTTGCSHREEYSLELAARSEQETPVHSPKRRKTTNDEAPF